MKEESKKKTTPAKTPAESERRLINLAMKLAEKQLRDGSASAQVISHFLKLATTREELELERMRSDIRLTEAKEKQMQSYEEIKGLFENAINAMMTYGGERHE